MVKRVASVALWFLAVGWAMNYVTLILGIPSIIGIAVAAVVSAVVGLDPLHLIWPVPEKAPEAAATDAVPAQRVVHSPG